MTSISLQFFLPTAKSFFSSCSSDFVYTICIKSWKCRCLWRIKQKRKGETRHSELVHPPFYVSCPVGMGGLPVGTCGSDDISLLGCLVWHQHPSPALGVYIIHIQDADCKKWASQRAIRFVRHVDKQLYKPENTIKHMTFSKRIILAFFCVNGGSM